MNDPFLKHLKDIETRWQKTWYDNKIFEPTYGEGMKFFFTIPYPYTNAPMHIGHSRTYTNGDIIARFKRLQGFNVLWPMAWHMTGTPVLSIASRIASGEQKTIKQFREYIGIYEDSTDRIDEIIADFDKPELIASYFASKISQDFRRMGYSIDFSRQFTTGDRNYNQFVTWQFQKLHEKNLIVQGKYPILYCTNDKNAVGEDDISGGDEVKIEITEMIMIRYEIDDDTYIVIATLRPETIYGVTNIWVLPDADYVKVDIGEEIWIVSKEAVTKLELQEFNPRIRNRIKGHDLIDQKVKHPFQEKDIPILPATFVDPSYGTGIVHSVPAHAIVDYLALQEWKQKSSEGDIDLIPVIDVEGAGLFPAKEMVDAHNLHDLSKADTIQELTKKLYSMEFYRGTIRDDQLGIAGLSVEEAKKAIKEMITQQGNSILYETSITSYCRCGQRVIVAVLPDQYFLNYGDNTWKHSARTALDEMEITPGKYRKLFERTFDWLDMRPCARRRGIGTRFPFGDDDWIIESLSDSTIYMAFYTIIKQIRAHKIPTKQLTEEFFDYVMLDRGNSNEISSKIGIKAKILEKIQEEFKYWYPNDQRHTAVNHISNHLSFAIYHHAAIFDEKDWIQKMSINEMLLIDGKKMSKSEGNVVPIAEIPEKYSVELTRLFMATTAALDTTIDFRHKEIEERKHQLSIFWETTNDIIIGETDESDLSNEGKYFVISIYSLFRQAYQQMERTNIREYGKIVFFEILNKVLHFKNKYPNQFYRVSQMIIGLWLQYLSPIIPHICEELWSKLEKDSIISTSSIPPPEETYYISQEEDEHIIVEHEYIHSLIDDIRTITQLRGVDPDRINLYLAPKWKYQVYHEIAEEMKKGQQAINFSKWMQHFGQQQQYRSYMNEIKNELKFISENYGYMQKLVDDDKFETSVLVKYEETISKEFGASVTIQNGSDNIYDPGGKAKNAKPMRPAIFLE